MKFEEHEIWGAPVRAVEDVPAVEPESAPIPPGSAGRLYRSSGSEPHPDAILALPHHRRHTTVQPIEATQWATPDPVAPPIAISSRIPRPVDDAAIAEVLATPSPQAQSTPPPPPARGFTDWYRSPEPRAELAALRSTGTIEDAPRTTRWQGLATVVGKTQELGAGAFALLVFGVTTVVALVNAVTEQSLGLPTGAALAVSAGVGAWRIRAESRWAAWVTPAYVLIGVILVAGQFSVNAPGPNPVGQLMLVATGLIALAPWLTAATVLGAVLPALHARRT